jgi:prolyl-tRNA editing enzyme YbaK/EbsC (Cys-tRNA(Pro) deacylase)
MEKLSSDHLQAYLQQHSITAEVLHLSVPTPTVELAAKAVGCQPEHIVKSILFLVKGEPVLTITCGARRVERRALASLYSVGRKRVKLARAETVLEMSGYEVGSMPPFGHKQQLTTLIDPTVLAKEEVYAGGGAENALLRISPQDIKHYSQAEVLDLHILPA